MTVKELIEELKKLPEEASVMFLRDFVGDEHSVARVEFKPVDYHNKEYGVVWLREM